MDKPRKFIDTVIQLIQFVGSLSTITISKLILNLEDLMKCGHH